MDHRALGQLGEQHAREFLTKLGYRIIASNYYTRAGEIDIIAKDRQSFVFVEVKTRTNIRFGYPETNMHWKKIKHFQNAAQLYLLRHDITAPFRLDVVSVDMTSGRPDILHYKNITL